MTQDKLLEKLAKIKAHADSAAKIGSAEEAQTFAEMLQKLLLKHNLEMTDIEFERKEQEEPVDAYLVDWEKNGVPLRRQRVPWQELLASVVARAHFCRVLVNDQSKRREELKAKGLPKSMVNSMLRDSNQIWLVGRKSDVAVAEYLLVTLTRAAESIAHKEYFVEYRKGARHGAAFKQAFLQAFVERIHERLTEARRAAERGSTAIVRFNRADEAVVKWLDDRKGGSAKDLPRPKEHWLGAKKGREAADRVNITGNAMESGPGPSQKLPAAEEWTKANSEAALRKGWDLFTVDPGTLGERRSIQRLDVGPRFESDAEALAYVREQAAAGNPLCQKALRLHQEAK